MAEKVVSEKLIKHVLGGHFCIGEEYIQYTTRENPLGFSVESLNSFFKTLRSGHRNVLRGHFGEDEANEIILDTEHKNFDNIVEFGTAGPFAGRLALSEYGIWLMEDAYHSEVSERPQLNTGFEKSLANAFGELQPN